MTGYGRTFELWRSAAADPWERYTRHAFVAGLADGSLPRTCFLHYLRQDYVFLNHFARAWALGVVKAAGLEEMKTCAATVDALVNHEMALHIRTCAAEGIGAEDLAATPESAANLAYTRYVLDAGFSGGFLDLMAALAPCVMGYGEIGARLAQEASSDTYRPWIDTYAGAEYQEVCRTVGEMLDRAVADRLGDAVQRLPAWSRLEARFRMATVLEVGFWQMGLDRA